MLLVMKQNYQNATTQGERDSIAATATQYRIDHSDYTVSADESLSDYQFTDDELYGLWLNGDEPLFRSLDSVSQDKLLYRLKHDIVIGEMQAGFPTVVAGMELGITLATLGELRVPAPKPQFRLKLDLQLFAAKKDLKMVNDAARQVGVNRNAFGEYIHELKSELKMKANQNFTWDELIRYATELKESMGK